MKPFNLFRDISLSMLWLWLTLFALLPIGAILCISFLSSDSTHLYHLPLTLNNIEQLVNPLYLKIFWRSFTLAAITTFICLILAYPFSYIISRMPRSKQLFMLLLVMIPFWTSSLIRSYAIMAIIKTKGLLNSALLWLGIIHQPLQILYTNTAVYIGLVYTLLPFMILPLYANMEKLDNRLLEAARDLGARRLTILTQIIYPHTKPGIFAGIIMVFLPAMTLFYIPVILGGAKSILLGNLIQIQFLQLGNWPQGSAISLLLMLILTSMLVYYWLRTKVKKDEILFA